MNKDNAVSDLPDDHGQMSVIMDENCVDEHLFDIDNDDADSEDELK
ncbi:unnamed protein product, partial [Rotaria sp. Silwood2]